MEVDKIVNTEYIPPAEKTSKKSCHKVSKRGKTKEILKLKTKYPDMSCPDIAKSVDCSRQNVLKTLNLYGLDTERINNYKNMQSEILNGAKEKLITELLTNPEKLKKASAKDLTISYSILFDKLRLLEGKSTQNVLSKVVELIDRDNE